MSKASSNQRISQATEEAESIITMYGEEPGENIPWTKRLERILASAFSAIIEEQRMPAFIACLLMGISFMQVAGCICWQKDSATSSDRFFYDAVDVLNIFRITPLIISLDDKITYLVCAYVFFSIQILYFLGIIVVYKHDSSSNKRYAILAQLESIVTPFMYWVLLNPTTELFSSIFRGSFTSGDLNHTVAGMSLWSAEHLCHVSLFSLSYFVCLLNTLLISTLGNDSNPYSSQNAFTRFPWTFEFFYASLRVVLSLAVQHIENLPWGWPLLYDAVIFLCIAAMGILYARYCLYYNKAVKVCFTMCVICVSWICLNDILFRFADIEDMSYRGRTVTTVFGLIFTHYLSKRLQYYFCELNIMAVNVSKLTNEDAIEVYMSEIIKLSALRDTECLSEEQSNFLLGCLFLHKQECTLPTCPMNNSSDYYLPLTDKLSKKDGRQVDDHVRLKFLIKRIYHNKIKEFTNHSNAYGTLDSSAPSTRLHISSAYYHICVIGNNCLGGYILDEAMSLYTSFWMKSAVYLLKRFLVRKQHSRSQLAGRNKNGKTESLEVRQVLEYEAYLARLKRKLSLAVESQHKFCGELLSPRPDLNRTYQLGMSLIDACENVTIAWDQLRAMGCNDAKAEIIYGFYLDSIRGKSDEAREHIKLTKIIEQRAAEACSAECIKGREAMFAEKASVIAIGTDRDNKHKIIKASNGVTRMFEYTPADIIGKDVSILMPEFLAKNHDKYVDDYIQMGRSSILNKSYETYGMGKENYIFTVYIYVREYYSVERGTMFLGLLHPCPREEATILTDCQGKIVGISYDVYAIISGLNPTMLHEQDIYLFYLCPNFYQELQGNEYANYEGSLTLTFNVPKNIQAVSSAIHTKLMMYTNDKENPKKATLEELFRTHFASSFSYNEGEKIRKWCTITTKKVRNGALQYKVVTFNKLGSKADNDTYSTAGRDIGDILDTDILTAEAKAQQISDAVALAKPSELASKSRTMVIKELALGRLGLKQALLSIFMRGRITRDPDNASDGPGFDDGRGEHEDCNDEGCKRGERQRSMFSVGGSAEEENDKRTEELRNKKTTYSSIENEIANIRNSSFANYTPKLIIYTQWVVTAFLLFMLVSGTVSFAYNFSAFTRVEYVKQLSSWTRIREASYIYDDITALSLMAPASDGAPLLDSAARGSYNYASIGYSSSQTMNYTEWKLANLINIAAQLNKHKNDIENAFVVLNNGDDTIMPSKVDWVFTASDGSDEIEPIIPYSALTILENEAVRIYAKTMVDISAAHSDAESVMRNWYYGVLMSFAGSTGVTLDTIKRSVDKASTASLLALVIMCSLTAFFIGGFVLILYSVTRETSAMLHFFTRISGGSLRTQIEKCTELAGLLNFDYGAGETRDGRERENENESEENSDKEEHDKDDSDKEGLRSPNGGGLKDERKEKRKEGRRRHKFYVEFRGDFWCRFAEMIFVFAFVNAYLIYCYLGPSSFYNTTDAHLKHIRDVDLILIGNVAVNTFTLEIISSNGTTTFQGYPLLYTLISYKQQATEIMEEMSNHFLKNRDSFSAKYQRIFQTIFYDNACMSEILGNTTECESINDASLTNGLYMTNSKTYDDYYQYILNYTFTPGPYRTLDYFRSIINSESIIELEIINRKYFNTLYSYAMSVLGDSLEENMLSQERNFALIYAAFLLVLALLYLVGWRLYANSIRRDLFSSKLIFAYLPLEMIIDSRSAAECITQFARGLLADTIKP